MPQISIAKEFDSCMFSWSHIAEKLSVCRRHRQRRSISYIATNSGKPERDLEETPVSN